jgi:hypothetical protein
VYSRTTAGISKLWSEKRFGKYSSLDSLPFRTTIRIQPDFGCWIFALRNPNCPRQRLPPAEEGDVNESGELTYFKKCCPYKKKTKDCARGSRAWRLRSTCRRVPG